MSDTNVAGFIEKILQTEINGAKSWVDDFKRGFPASMWEMFMRLPVTAESVGSISGGISLQVSRASRKVPKELSVEIIRSGHLFLREIYEKAKELRIEVDLKNIDWIFAPGLEQIGETLHHVG